MGRPLGAFASVPGLAELTEEDRLRFEKEAVTLRVPRGTMLVRQGDPTNELYIVLAGRFFVTLDSRPGVIAEIGPGEPIGELAFFGNVARTANVVAARDSEVLLLTREAYANIVRHAPGIQARILTSDSGPLGGRDCCIADAQGAAGANGGAAADRRKRRFAGRFPGATDARACAAKGGRRLRRHDPDEALRLWRDGNRRIS